MSEIIRAIESEQLKKDLPKFNVGDTLRVMVKVVEGDRERLQAFEGICIAKRNGSIRETFTLRRVSYGIGVERTFPLHSPRLDKITVLRRGKVRRAKLYYLRDRVGKAVRLAEKNVKLHETEAQDKPKKTMKRGKKAAADRRAKKAAENAAE